MGSPMDDALEAPRSDREGLWAEELAVSRKPSKPPGLSLLLYLSQPGSAIVWKLAHCRPYKHLRTLLLGLAALPWPVDLVGTLLQETFATGTQS